MKNHALRRIALVSVILLVLMLGVIVLVSTLYFRGFTADNCAKDAQKLKTSIDEILTYYDFSRVERSAEDEDYMLLREFLRYQCQQYGAKYICLFHADTDKDMMEYIMVSAGDDRDHEQIADERSLGTEIALEKNQYILQAADGGFSEAEHFYNEFGDMISYYFPVEANDPDGRPLLAGVDFEVTEINRKALDYTLRITVTAAGVLTLMLAALLFVLRRKVFVPIKQISMQMNSFDPEKEQPELEIRSYREIEEIGESFNAMSKDIVRYIGDIRLMADERARSSAELNVARSIQIGMVPKEHSESGSGYELRAFAFPAREVGGDFYDCFMSGNGLCFVIADVSGKGIASALFMAMTKNLIREKLKAGLSPAEALNSVNDELCSQNPEGMFVTAFAAVLDTRTGEVRYANAGHTRPLMLGSEKRFLVPDTGTALGVFEDAGIVDEYLMLRDGEGMLIYTDGVTEAVSAGRELFGEQRIIDEVRAGSADESASSLTEAVKSFSEGCEQSDDLTLLTVYYRSTGVTESMELPAEPPAMREIRSVVNRLAEGSENRLRFCLACEETVQNIIDYSGSPTIAVTAVLAGGTLTVRLEDSGKPFDPVANMPAEKDFDECDSGGMGIRLVTQIASSVVYSRIGDKNILVMEFKL
ncbi:MAG: SpoIIE family protein phosphatase [Ruminococcus sp.]|nr:SpoIIE family protein phosphatase [Ruminococcus sp.]